MSDSRLEATYSFYNIEVELFCAGRLAFFRMARKTLRNQLIAAGAFGPFRLTIRHGDGVTVPHTLVMWEAY